MPRDYAGLAALLIPRPIHDEIDYINTVEMAERLPALRLI